MASGIGSSILKKLLPVLVGMLISGMLGRKSSKAAPAESPRPQKQSRPWPAGAISGISCSRLSDAASRSRPARHQLLPSKCQRQAVSHCQSRADHFLERARAEQPFPSGDLLGQLLRELGKAIQEGRVKPIVVEMPIPGGQPMPSAPPRSGEGAPNPRWSGRPAPNDEMLPGPKMPTGGQPSGGDILGNILRELLGGASASGSRLTQASGFGSAVFGDRFEPGQDIDPRDVDDIQRLFDQFSNGQRG